MLDFNIEKFFRDVLRSWLGVGELEQRVSLLERNLTRVEDLVSGSLQHFGRYQSRTDAELVLMRNQIQALLDTLEDVQVQLDEQGDPLLRKRFMTQRRRLRNNLTRIEKALSSLN